MKKRKNTSILWNISKESLQEILDNSTSISCAIGMIGVDGRKPHYYNILKERIQNENLSTTKMYINYLEVKTKNAGKIPNDRLFTKDSVYRRDTVRCRIKNENLKEYKCSECGIVDEYNGKEITLQIDHINGVRNDHRLDNLRWLCPNCHSQQSTSFNKGSKDKLHRNKKVSLCECGSVKDAQALRCKSCDSKNRIGLSRKFEADVDDLINLLLSFPMTAIGKIFGVSNNAVKKRCVMLGIDLEDVKRRKRELKKELP